VKRAFIELLYLTAIRPAQLKSTETSNVRVERGQVTALVYRPKQGKQKLPHEAPLVGRTQELVQELWRGRRLGCRLLIHFDRKRLGELKSEWRRACAAEGAHRRAEGRGRRALQPPALVLDEPSRSRRPRHDGARHQRPQDRLGAPSLRHHADHSEAGAARAMMDAVEAAKR
jgi:hypothetical protein